jgi:electron transfer flavoprotein beta subunit
VKIRLDPETKAPATATIEQVNNAFDTYAVELAARYCEAHGGTVTVVSVGPESAKNSLKNLLAVGANKAFLLCDSMLDNADENAMATYLSEIVKKCEVENGAPYNLILCGKESTDEISGQVGAMMAEKLGLGFVSSVIEIEPNDAGFMVKQETEDGYALYEVISPALFTIAKPNYDPRYPTIKSKMTARKAEIPMFSAADASIVAEANRIICLGYSEPSKKEAGVRIQGLSGADAAVKAIAMMTDSKVL